MSPRIWEGLRGLVLSGFGRQVASLPLRRRLAPEKCARDRSGGGHDKEETPQPQNDAHGYGTLLRNLHHLAADPGKEVTVRLLDPQGQTLAGVIAAGVVPAPLNALSLKGADCSVYALDPERPRQVLFLHCERRLGGVRTLRGDEQGPVVVTLAPTGVVTGRLLDADGRPVADTRIGARYAGRAGNALLRETARRYDLPRAGADGRFRLECILPGLEFDLAFVKGRQALFPEGRLKVKPLTTGQTLDLGDIRTKPRQP